LVDEVLIRIIFSFVVVTHLLICDEINFNYFQLSKNSKKNKKPASLAGFAIRSPKTSPVDIGVM